MKDIIKTYTIGFTKKNADRFFSLLRLSDTKKLIDVRLNNGSQLAGFAKKNDLKFFLQELCGIEYIHIPELAPTKHILDQYKKHGGSWYVYENEFNQLMADRNIEKIVKKDMLNYSCLLCSEHEPIHCHRRLVVEYLNCQWKESISVDHLI